MAGTGDSPIWNIRDLLLHLAEVGGVEEAPVVSGALRPLVEVEDLAPPVGGGVVEAESRAAQVLLEAGVGEVEGREADVRAVLERGVRLGEDEGAHARK